MEDNMIYHKQCGIPPMAVDQKLLLKDVNNFFICRLCGGYLIDATGLIECSHTYCRPCIVQFLQKSPFCPICEVQVNKTKPLHSLRPDAIMQRLVYKTVPGLYKSELLRRKKYLDDLETNDLVLSDDESESREYYFDPEEPISISLEYVEYIRTIRNQSNEKDLIEFQDETLAKKLEEQTTYKRYLQCPAALKIRHIYKFIKLKYNLKKTHEVEILYENSKLPSYFSLMDTAYTFSWNREKPMRLCYQIFERKVIQVPLLVENEISDAYVPPKNDFIPNSSSTTSSSLNNSSESSKNEDEQSLTSTLDSPCKNLKRKCESLSENEKNNNGDKKFLCELELKIPRISVDALPRSDETKDDLKTFEVSSNLCSENGAKMQIKTPSNDSGTYSDDYVKYEQDIEEVDDDDDDDDRLRISQISDEELILEEKVQDTPPEQVSVIDTSDVDRKDECSNEVVMQCEDIKAVKYRRKSKKSKHHHHRRHHHRHHDRKKPAREATILHSPDTDIMKLKVKLNTVVATSDSKHHKQSRRKRKRSPEMYFSSSSPSSRASSITASSPDHANGISRTDEDSLHSHISEVSAESFDNSVLKDEPSKEAETSTLQPEVPAPLQPMLNQSLTVNELSKEQPSPSTKEKLLQMRAFRPKSIAVVKPEENDKKVMVVDVKTTTTTIPKNDSNNNHDKVPTQTVEQPLCASILRPTTSSSITVSKITAAEKMLMEQEKRLNGANEERPSLEITLVSEPAKNCPASPTHSITFSDSVSSTTAKVKPPISRTMKPLPPLVQLPKSSAKAMSIVPCGKHPQLQRSVKSLNSELSKKIKDTFPMIKTDGAKQSVTISLSGNHFSNDLIAAGALDLSGKQCKITDKALLNRNMAAMAAAQVMQHAKKAYVHPYGGTTSSQQSPVNSTPLTYNPVSCMASLAENKRLLQCMTSKEAVAAAQFQYMLPFPMMQSPRSSHHGHHKMFASPPCTSPGPHIINLPITSTSNNNNNNLSKTINKVATMPALNEIKIGPVSSAVESVPQHKPGPNQNIRNIPNPSRLLRRQQPIGSVGPMVVGAANSAANNKCTNGGVPVISHRLGSSMCSFTGHKKNGEKCLQAVLPKAYLDHSSIMVTK